MWASPSASASSAFIQTNTRFRNRSISSPANPPSKPSNAAIRSSLSNKAGSPTSKPSRSAVNRSYYIDNRANTPLISGAAYGTLSHEVNQRHQNSPRTRCHRLDSIVVDRYSVADPADPLSAPRLHLIV